MDANTKTGAGENETRILRLLRVAHDTSIAVEKDKVIDLSDPTMVVYALVHVEDLLPPNVEHIGHQIATSMAIFTIVVTALRSMEDLKLYEIGDDDQTDQKLDELIAGIKEQASSARGHGVNIPNPHKFGGLVQLLSMRMITSSIILLSPNDLRSAITEESPIALVDKGKAFTLLIRVLALCIIAYDDMKLWHFMPESIFNANVSDNSL